MEDLPVSRSQNFDTEVRRVLNAWKDEWETKADSDHTHDGGNTILLSVVANEAALGAGATDGELKVTESFNWYQWDDGNSKWRVKDGSKYATGSLPVAASYTIPTGTRVFNTTTGEKLIWDGSAWDDDDDSITAILLGGD